MIYVKWLGVFDVSDQGLFHIGAIVGRFRCVELGKALVLRAIRVEF